MPPGVSRRGQSLKPPVLPPSGAICPAFQPRRREADVAGMGRRREGRNKKSSPNHPPGREGLRLGPGRVVGGQGGYLLRIEEGRIESPPTPPISRDLSNSRCSTACFLLLRATGDPAGRNRIRRNWARGDQPGREVVTEARALEQRLPVARARAHRPQLCPSVIPFLTPTPPHPHMP